MLEVSPAVKISGMPAASQAAITSSSRFDPPGWMIAAIPAALARAIESANGRTHPKPGPRLGHDRRPCESRFQRNQRALCPAPTPRTILFLANRIALLFT